MLFTKSALNCVLGPLLSATPGVRTNKATMSLQRRLHRRKWPPSAVRTRPLIRSPKLFDRRIELQTASPCQSPGDRLRGDPPSPRVSPRFADRRPRCITPEQGGTLNMSPAELVWGSYASPRVLFGVSPNRVSRRDAGNCTGDSPSASQPSLETVTSQCAFWK